jgi:hypothetical protein
MDFNARIDRSLLALMPDVKRAREFRLYDLDGKRYLDAYLDSGAALLGHRPAGLSTTLKNELDRGGFAAFPSAWSRRCGAALHSLFPNHATIRVYTSSDRAVSALAMRGIPSPVDDILRFPAAGEKPADDVADAAPPAAIWRPFLPDQPDSDILFPVLPFPLWPSPQMVVFRDDPGDSVPPSDVVAPFWLAGLARAAVSVKANSKTYAESLWRRFEVSAGGVWTRRGPYLYPRCSAPDYPDFFRFCLASGVLVSPDFHFPSIVPGLFTSGDLQGLRKKTESNRTNEIDGANNAGSY